MRRRVVWAAAALTLLACSPVLAGTVLYGAYWTFSRAGMRDR